MCQRSPHYHSFWVVLLVAGLPILGERNHALNGFVLRVAFSARSSNGSICRPHASRTIAAQQCSRTCRLASVCLRSIRGLGSRSCLASGRRGRRSFLLFRRALPPLPTLTTHEQATQNQCQTLHVLRGPAWHFRHSLLYHICTPRRRRHRL